ncbi:MAG: hypothetical protein IT160_19680 [Bryobacterales bacterium]|nr:hypothetical protein [Bryobacterales bacterium]
MQRLSKMMSKMGDVWCDVVHDNASWPVQGHYYCKTCWRAHRVPWALAPTAAVERRETGTNSEATIGHLAPAGSRA